MVSRPDGHGHGEILVGRWWHWAMAPFSSSEWTHIDATFASFPLHGTHAALLQRTWFLDGAG